ncbi:MAG: hypothetical protein ACPGWR_28105 [Ardenticatenaceae bacterium]
MGSSSSTEDATLLGVPEQQRLPDLPCLLTWLANGKILVTRESYTADPLYATFIFHDPT